MVYYQKPSYTEWYREYKIVITPIDADWSEAAYRYEVVGTAIKDQCEGEEQAIAFAQEDIDFLLDTPHRSSNKNEFDL